MDTDNSALLEAVKVLRDALGEIVDTAHSHRMPTSLAKGQQWSVTDGAKSEAWAEAADIARNALTHAEGLLK